MLLDRADRAIVTALQENARLTNVELSERIGLSASACLRRVNTLERKGLIAGYHATIDMAKIDYDVMVMVQITLTGQASTILNDFERAVVRIPNLLACFLMAGTKDYILRVAARDVADYGQIHANHLSSLPHVQSMESNFILRSVMNRGLPVELL
ncbi:MAG: Leucine-responsive regulatory protein [SAR116 cluster bacterium MED-G04]|jgi:Lrp/AsnC family leucine-responsive transcriptional regulator|nr:AsnC family transcriptional regulator [SAR116 cluster bacterium]OUW36422.1 MAG: AsnC family transcriptional regulator [Gammaproteobacteria bacterium TMED183]CAI8336811.1 MAG: Leucine-responsive regulatory protein [SAR116 cluster bacterium MED-G04]